MAPDAPIVVKLGGSFAYSDYLQDWIEALAASPGRVVIVPGGGPFADAVRLAQRQMRFDDKAAHHMAVLAMEQYGRALASFNSLLSLADSPDAILRDLREKRVPVWMPSAMVLAATDIAPSWSVTSDSLAAWLAGKIGAGRLWIVKHAKLSAGSARLKDLIAARIVDDEFARFLQMMPLPVSILGPSDHDTTRAAIRDGTSAGIAVQ
jgi:5-(aminomethyl)-3-furanmethanol phosphate kinase